MSVTFKDLVAAVKARRTAAAVAAASALPPTKADPESGETPLQWAARRGIAPVVKALAKRAKQVDAFDHDGRTALHHAVASGSMPTVRVLLAAGANPNRWNTSEGQVLHGAPLHFACENGDVKMVALLLDAGADPKGGRWAKQMGAPLHVAVKSKGSGRKLIVRQLLAAGADANAKGDIAQTPLHVACAHGARDVIEVLLAAGARADLRDDDGNAPADLAKTPAIIALLERKARGAKKDDGLARSVKLGDRKRVKKALDAGADTEARDAHGQTMLIVAAWKGDIALARSLLDRGADPNAVADRGSTALLAALSRGHAELAELLLARGADPAPTKEAGQAALVQAAGRGLAALTRRFLEGRDPNSAVTFPLGYRLLHTAVAARSAGSPETVAVLLEAGANANEADHDGDTPLHLAAKDGNAAIVKLLLDAGADPCARGDESATPLDVAANAEVRALVAARGGRSRDDTAEVQIFKAIDEHDRAAVARLIKKGVRLDARQPLLGRTPLAAAVIREDEKILKLLLDAGAPIDAAASDDGVPALVIAAMRGLEGPARVLVERGASLTGASGTHRLTVLHAAVEGGLLWLVERAVDAGVDVDARSGDDTPLLVAAQHDRATCVPVLVAAGARTNAASRTGFTPLHWAAYKGHPATVRALLDAGVDVAAKDKNGKTALAVTMSRAKLVAKDEAISLLRAAAG